MTLRSLAFLSLALSLPAQTPSPKFEVASIHVVDPAAPRTSTSGIRGTAQQLSIVRMGLRELITTAFGLRPSRIEGPGWAATSEAGNFNIEAKLPDGATSAQLPILIRSLLEDRFALKWHWTKRISDYYAVVVDSSGSKLVRKAPATDDFSAADWVSSGGVFQSGSIKTIERPGGHTTLEMSTLADVVSILNPHFGGLPIIDKTGLTGQYDIKIEYDIPDAALARAQGRLTPEFLSDLRDAYRKGVITGIESLGLRIEKRRGEVEFLVLDSMNKVPNEN